MTDPRDLWPLPMSSPPKRPAQDTKTPSAPSALQVLSPLSPLQHRYTPDKVTTRPHPNYRTPSPPSMLTAYNRIGKNGGRGGNASRNDNQRGGRNNSSNFPIRPWPARAGLALSALEQGSSAHTQVGGPSFRDYMMGPVTPPKNRRGGRNGRNSSLLQPPVTRQTQNQLMFDAKTTQHWPQARPVTQSTVRPPPTQPRNMPIRKPVEEWRKVHSITINLKYIPFKFTLLDIYDIFSRFGQIDYMELCENDRGVKDGSGKIKFSPPPYDPFWNQSPIHGTLNGIRYEIICTPGSLSSPLPISNPVTKIKMPAILTFEASSLDFGFMHEEHSMVAMFTTRKDFPVKFVINFNKRIIDIFFKHRFDPKDEDSLMREARDEWIKAHPESPEAVEARRKRPGDPNLKPREEEYRFQIPFEQLSKMAEERVSSMDTRVFVAPLQSPPEFYRKLGNMRYSLQEGDQTIWSQWNAWIRQTDIMPFALLLQDYPVSLQKKLCTIDIGRWTTYRFTFKLGETNDPQRIGEMIQYLKDFNVDTEVFEQFQVNPHRPKAIWEDIDDASPDPQLGSETLHLPFPVRYQLEAAISQGRLNEYSIKPEFIKKLISIGQARAVELLEHVTDTAKTRFWDPMTIFDLKEEIRGFSGRVKLKPESQLVRRVTVTPTTVIYNTPSVEITNRILRRYQEHADRFLRVHFADERKEKLRHNGGMSKDEVLTRVYRALERGITIGDRHFEFLAFGSSQFREHGAYMFAPTQYLSTDEIREWMGNFEKIKTVAKYCARLGQCFSTSYAIKTVRVDIKKIDDIERNGYTFTDGVGKISECAAALIVADLSWRLPRAPSAFQFRLGGSKGVLTVWPDVSGRDVLIRPSQEKFTAKHDVLEIIRHSQFAQATLNRQLIQVLCALGTRDEVFIKMLKKQLSDLENAMTDPSVAIDSLTKWIDENQMSIMVAGLIRDGFMDAKEPFVLSLLHLWRAWKMQFLKEKARLDVEQGAFLIGVVDEVGVLKGHFEKPPDLSAVESKEEDLPEIFCQVPIRGNPSEYIIIQGICLIARNPSLHPGDIRTVRAVDKPELRHLRDVLVLPQTGDRDLGNMCSGGDLDGDDYVVIWDKEIIPGIGNFEPMDYTPDRPEELDRPITVQDMIGFFVKYMKNDRLGTIAHTHLAWADRLDDGVLNPKCIELSRLHSMAVDYPKSGQPASLPRSLRIKKYPHFMQKEDDRTYYSHKILGRLYDMVQKVDFQPIYNRNFDQRLLRYPVSKKLLLCARSMKIDYDVSMRRTMAQYDIKTEHEVYSTFVMSFKSEGKSHYTFHEEIIKAIDALSDRFRTAVYKKLDTRDNRTVGIFAVAIYKITYLEMCQALDNQRSEDNEMKPPEHKGKEKREKKDKDKNPMKRMPLSSFAWLFRDLLGRLANSERPFDGITFETELDVPTWSDDGKEETEEDYCNIDIDTLFEDNSDSEFAEANTQGDVGAELYEEDSSGLGSSTEDGDGMIEDGETETDDEFEVFTGDDYDEEYDDEEEVEGSDDEYAEGGYADGYAEDGYDEDGYDEDGYDEDGYAEDGYAEDEAIEDESAINKVYDEESDEEPAPEGRFNFCDPQDHSRNSGDMDPFSDTKTFSPVALGRCNREDLLIYPSDAENDESLTANDDASPAKMSPSTNRHGGEDDNGRSMLANPILAKLHPAKF